MIAKLCGLLNHTTKREVRADIIHYLGNVLQDDDTAIAQLAIDSEILDKINNIICT